MKDSPTQADPKQMSVLVTTKGPLKAWVIITLTGVVKITVVKVLIWQVLNQGS